MRADVDFESVSSSEWSRLCRSCGCAGNEYVDAAYIPKLARPCTARRQVPARPGVSALRDTANAAADAAADAADAAAGCSPAAVRVRASTQRAYNPGAKDSPQKTNESSLYGKRIE